MKKEKQEEEFEHADKCRDAWCCNHGRAHEQFEGCIKGVCYHHSKTGENACLPVLESFS